MTNPIQANSPFAMAKDELDAFLQEPRYACISSLRQSGAPVGIVAGIEWDGEAAWLSIRGTRLLVKRIARDPRICITVFNQEYPPKYVILQGRAEPVDDPGYQRIYRRLERSMGPQSSQLTVPVDLEEFWKNYTAVGRVLYRMVPDSIVSEDGGKWDHERIAGAGISDELARARGDIGPDEGVFP